MDKLDKMGKTTKTETVSLRTNRVGTRSWAIVKQFAEKLGELIGEQVFLDNAYFDNHDIEEQELALKALMEVVGYQEVYTTQWDFVFEELLMLLNAGWIKRFLELEEACEVRASEPAIKASEIREVHPQM